jgi:hypothetical protein
MRAAILPRRNVRESVATKMPLLRSAREVVKWIFNESRFCQSKTRIRMSFQVRDLNAVCAHVDGGTFKTQSARSGCEDRRSATLPLVLLDV